MSAIPRICALASRSRVAAMASSRLPVCTRLSFQNMSLCHSNSVSKQTARSLVTGPLPKLFLSPVSVNFTQQRNATRKGCAKIPPTKPLSFEYGGDTEWTPLVEFNDHDPVMGFQDLPELELADDRVKQMFSFGFADGRVRLQQEMEKVMQTIQDHPADVKSLESRIARMTVHIRKQIAHCLAFRHDKRSKVKLVEGMAKRKTLLKELRRLDIEKFTWLTNELKLTYTPRPDYTRKISKKKARKQAARDACWALINKKMDQLREKIAEEKISFMQHKEEELKRIENELKQLGLEMKPTIKETVESMGLGREVFPKEKRMKRRNAILQRKFELYGIHSRNRGKHARVKFFK